MSFLKGSNGSVSNIKESTQIQHPEIGSTIKVKVDSKYIKYIVIRNIRDKETRRMLIVAMNQEDNTLMSWTLGEYYHLCAEKIIKEV